MPTRIEEMNLRPSLYQALRRSGIYTAEQLATYSDGELSTLRFMADPYVHEIDSRLQALGLQRPLLVPPRRRRRAKQK